MLCQAVVLLSSTAQGTNAEDLVVQCNTNRPLIEGYVAGAFDKSIADSDNFVRFYFETFDGRQTPELVQKRRQAVIRSSLAVEGYSSPQDVTLEERADVDRRYLAAHPSERMKTAAELLGGNRKMALPMKFRRTSPSEHDYEQTSCLLDRLSLGIPRERFGTASGLQPRVGLSSR